MNQSQVLIIGAGPTGLAAAVSLAKLGVKVRIIDKGQARSDKSKALGESFANSARVESFWLAMLPIYTAPPVVKA